MKIISNNTVFSNFAYVDRLDLLKGIYSELYMSFEVYKEVENGIKHKHFFQKRTKQIADSQEWLFVTELWQSEIELYKRLKQKLDTGEASCLAIAINRGWGFLTDDIRARRLTEFYNVHLSGTIGVLYLANGKKLISTKEADDLLQKMRAKGYRSPVSRIEDIL